jgi:methionine sulfoxide reductase heme-binding subunit
VVLGALNVGRFSAVRWPRFSVSAVHRNLSLLGLAFLVVHVVTAVVDPYAGIGWLDAVVPFGSVYRPLWLGLGAVAGDLMLAVVLTSLLRRWINLRAWRLLHWTVYLIWPLSIVHGLGTGVTDDRLRWVLVVNMACGLAGLAAIGWRMTGSHPDTQVRNSVQVGR